MTLEGFPSTNGRIVATIVVYGATAVRYLVWGVPDGGDWAWGAWLGVLAGMAGIDVAQFVKKRRTADPDVIAATAAAKAAQDCAPVPPAPDPTPRPFPGWIEPPRPQIASQGPPANSVAPDD